MRFRTAVVLCVLQELHSGSKNGYVVELQNGETVEVPSSSLRTLRKETCIEDYKVGEKRYRLDGWSQMGFMGFFEYAVHSLFPECICCIEPVLRLAEALKYKKSDELLIELLAFTNGKEDPHKLLSMPRESLCERFRERIDAFLDDLYIEELVGYDSIRRFEAVYIASLNMLAKTYLDIDDYCDVTILYLPEGFGRYADGKTRPPIRVDHLVITGSFDEYPKWYERLVYKNLYICPHAKCRIPLEAVAVERLYYGEAVEDVEFSVRRALGISSLREWPENVNGHGVRLLHISGFQDMSFGARQFPDLGVLVVRESCRIDLSCIHAPLRKLKFTNICEDIVTPDKINGALEVLYVSYAMGKNPDAQRTLNLRGYDLSQLRSLTLRGKSKKDSVLLDRSVYESGLETLHYENDFFSLSEVAECWKSLVELHVAFCEQPLDFGSFRDLKKLSIEVCSGENALLLAEMESLTHLLIKASPMRFIASSRDKRSGLTNLSIIGADEEIDMSDLELAELHRVYVGDGYSKAVPILLLPPLSVMKNVSRYEIEMAGALIRVKGEMGDEEEAENVVDERPGVKESDAKSGGLAGNDVPDDDAQPTEDSDAGEEEQPSPAANSRPGEKGPGPGSPSSPKNRVLKKPRGTRTLPGKIKRKRSAPEESTKDSFASLPYMTYGLLMLVVAAGICLGILWHRKKVGFNIKAVRDFEGSRR
jgi:hypothetical protein